jgi:hypothetical protein
VKGGSTRTVLEQEGISLNLEPFTDHS